MITLSIEKLTKEDFEPYGQIIEAGPDADQFLINEGNTIRFHDLAKIELIEAPHNCVPQPKPKPIISIFRGKPRKLPFKIDMLERHPLGSQAFIPLNDRRWLTVVALGKLKPELETLRVFLAEGRQGLNYAAGVWHHPLLALDKDSDFLIVDRQGPGENLETHTLTFPYAIPIITEEAPV